MLGKRGWFTLDNRRLQVPLLLSRRDGPAHEVNIVSAPALNGLANSLGFARDPPPPPPTTSWAVWPTTFFTGVIICWLRGRSREAWGDRTARAFLVFSKLHIKGASVLPQALCFLNIWKHGVFWIMFFDIFPYHVFDGFLIGFFEHFGSSFSIILWIFRIVRKLF